MPIGVLAGHVGDDADVRGLEGAGQVAAGPPVILRDFGARGEADLEQGDYWARVDVYDLAFDLVFQQGGLELYLALLAR